MTEPKKQNFLHGTMLLAGATALVKVIGALYKIPLNDIIGEKAYGYFTTAYDIYNVLLMISTAGLPVAMSRMVSQASAMGNYRQVRKIYSVSQTIFLTLGGIGSLLMVALCRQLAAFQNQPDSWAAIAALGPSVFLICLMSAYRGFFQGQGNMLPTSTSQVIEAMVKLVVGIGGATLMMKLTQDITFGAAGAIAGVTVSCLVSSVYLSGCFRKAYRTLPEGRGRVKSGRSIAIKLLAIAIPITLGSAALQLINLAAVKVYMSRLLESFGAFMTQDAAQDLADTQRGIHGFMQTIFNLPCSFITPVTISVIPAVTAQLTEKNHAAVRGTEESAVRVTGLLAAPCAVGLTLIARPVVSLLGGYTGDNLLLATRMLTVLGISVLFNAVVLLTNAIMQAHGHVTMPVVHMLIGGVLKLTIIYILAGNPNIGIVAAPIGTLSCFICIMILNLFAMKRLFERPPRIFASLIRSVMAALVMGAAVYLAYLGTGVVLQRFGIEGRMAAAFCCGIPVAVGVAVYVPVAVALGAIRKKDCLLLPKGAKIAKLLRLK